MATSKTRKVTIENVSGVSRFSFELRPGVTVLTGENGAGKSSTFNATARLFGSDSPVEVRDGADHGTVEMDGVKLVIRKVARATGTADVQLADVGALAALIDPQMKDTAAAARARVRALLSLSKLPVTDEAVAMLADDEEVAARAVASIRTAGTTDLLGAAERVRLEAHGAKRQAESEGEQAAGEAATLDAQAKAALLDVGGADKLVTTSAADAEAAERAATEEYARAGLLARQRSELEAQQAEVRASLGQAPDPAALDAGIIRTAEGSLERARAARVDGAREVERCLLALKDAEASMAIAEEKVKGAAAELDRQRAQKDAEAEALRRFEARRAILDRPITGPTPGEVAALSDGAEMARIVSARARLSDTYRSAHDRAAFAHQRAAELASRAARLETVATTVGDRLGRLLSGTAAEGLTVVDGRLAVVGPDGRPLDFETRQSEGQRARIAFRIAARAFAGRVVPLDGKLWSTWDPKRRAEIAGIAAEEGMYVLTEEPTDDVSLGAKHLGSNT